MNDHSVANATSSRNDVNGAGTSNVNGYRKSEAEGRTTCTFSETSFSNEDTTALISPEESGPAQDSVS